MSYLDWELDNRPGCFDVPRSDEYIDRVTLMHVISNIDRPDDVDEKSYVAVINEVCATLHKFPYFRRKPVWTSVDSEPVNEGRYLVRNESGNVFTLSFAPDMDEPQDRWGVWVEYYDGNTLGWNGEDWEPAHGITHWMQMPDEPEESDEE